MRPRLHLSYPHSWQGKNQYHGAWWITYQDLTLNVSIFIVSGKREGEERERETPPSLNY